MSNQQPKNQLSFVRETLEKISIQSKLNKYNGSHIRVLETLRDRYHTQKIPILDYLANIRKDSEKKQSKIDLDPYTQIYLCINIVQEHIIYFEVKQIDDDDILKYLNNIRDLFKSILKENKPKFLKFINNFKNNIVSKIQDPEFISENIIRAALSLEVGETLKKLPEFIDKILPPN